MRWALKALAALIVGAIVTVLVSWGCAVWVKFPPPSARLDVGADVLSFAPSSWSRAPMGREREYEVHLGQCQAWHGAGRTVGLQSLWCTWRSPASDTHYQSAIGEVTIQQSGWPFS